MAEPCPNTPRTRARWGIIETDVLFNLRLSMGARYVYAAIAGSVNARGETEFCQATFAARAGRSRPWLNAALLELERFGLLRVERVYADGLQRANRYVLTDRLERNGGKGREPNPVGETPLETDLDIRQESFQAGSDQSTGAGCTSVDGADSLVASAVKPADTSHDSDSDLSLSEPRERANRDTGKGRDGDQERPAIPPDWTPNADDLAWASKARPGLDVPAFTERFILACRAKPYIYADYHTAWRQWILTPKSPLPMIRQPIILSGETDHAPSRFSASGSRPGSGRKISRDGSGQERKSFSSGTGGLGGDLAAVNASRAHACLERILGRRAGGPLA
jgi:hypothetical protein